MNLLAWVVDALKVPSEPMLPEALTDASPIQLAEARSRLQEISRVANELRKLVDQELAGALQGSALNYGGQIMRPNNARGSAKVIDSEAWWAFVDYCMQQVEETYDRAKILNSLYPASSLRLTALPKLAEVADMAVEQLKDTFITYDPPTSPLSVMPKDKAPKYLQDLEEGQIR